MITATPSLSVVVHERTRRSVWKERFRYKHVKYMSSAVMEKLY